jgi:DNA-directed RNA polymerase subunit RPC12/RpoP
MTCSICHKPLPKGDAGRNAYPVNDGYCCRECNERVVVPARMKVAKEWDNPKGGVQ